VFTIRAGRIAEFQEYIDTAAIMAALRSEQTRA
jgi:ketosteroid isomerase-like protein